jgi:hypothetical protein
MGGNSLSKPRLSVSISNVVVRIELADGRCVFFRLGYIVFGSKTSTDYDVLVWVSNEFIGLNLESHILIDICKLFEQCLIPFIGSDKPINASLAHWENGQVTWDHKGTDDAETNNSLMDTFANHLDKQMYKECSITKRLPRDVWKKIIGSIRDLICNLHKVYYHNEDKYFELMTEMALTILSIPELQT